METTIHSNETTYTGAQLIFLSDARVQEVSGSTPMFCILRKVRVKESTHKLTVYLHPDGLYRLSTSTPRGFGCGLYGTRADAMHVLAGGILAKAA